MEKKKSNRKHKLLKEETAPKPPPPPQKRIINEDVSFNFKKKSKRLIKIKSWNGIGDLLFCTPTLHAIKQSFPEAHITVSTNCPQLLEGNPYVDKIDRITKEGTFLGYADPIHKKNPTKHHIKADWEIIKNEYDLGGLKEPQLKPEIYLPVAKERGATIGVQVMHKGHWDRKKVWPKFDELSKQPGFRPIPKFKDHKEMVSAISRYKAVVCAEGGISAIAKAVGTPAVVIFGGFASPSWSGYEDHINICNPQPCSYCYNPDKCTNLIHKKCMVEITMEQVLRVVEGLGKIPELHTHNAKQFIASDALKWCVGKGIDVGGGRDPLKGSVNIDPVPGTNQENVKIDLKDNSQDFVFSSHTLEHLQNPSANLKEWVRVLKPNGIMYLYLPHDSYVPWRKASMSRWHLHDLTSEVLWNWFKSIPQMEVVEHIERDFYFGRKIILVKRVA